MKKHEKEREKLLRTIKDKGMLRSTLQKRVPILIRNNDSSLEDLYKQIEGLTVEIYQLEVQLFKDKENEKKKEKTDNN